MEIIFHETSHGMMSRVTNAIENADKAITAGHRNSVAGHGLWHEVLFYTTGELVAELVPGYVPCADKNGLWDHAWKHADREAFERDWKPHMKGTVSLDAALAKLANDLSLARDPQHK